MNVSAITFDETIEEETRKVITSLRKKNCLQKKKFPHFTCFRINYHCIIDSC